MALRDQHGQVFIHQQPAQPQSAVRFSQQGHLQAQDDHGHDHGQDHDHSHGETSQGSPRWPPGVQATPAPAGMPPGFMVRLPDGRTGFVPQQVLSRMAAQGPQMPQGMSPAQAMPPITLAGGAPLPAGLMPFQLPFQQQQQGQQGSSVPALSNNAGGGLGIIPQSEGNFPASDGQQMKDIHQAATDGDLDTVKEWIERRRCDVDAPGKDGETALHWAAFKNNLKVAKYLLDHGATIDATTRVEAQTPLMWAAIEGHIKLVHFLVEAGADIQRCDGRGYNACHHAVQYNQTLVVHYLLKRGLQVDARDNEGHTNLMWAAYRNHDDCMRYLLAHGADYTMVDYSGCSALHWAAVQGNGAAANVMLEETRVDLSLKDNDGESASAMAARKNHPKLAAMIRQMEKRPWRRMLNETQLKALWFGVTFLGSWFFFLMATVFPNLLLGIVITWLVMFGAQFLLKGLSLNENHRNPMYTGVVAGWYSISAYVYFTRVFPLTNYYSMETMLFVLLNLGWVPQYARLLFSDPGWIKPAPGEWEAFLRACEREDEDLPGFCVTCETRRPLRSKHCRSCGKCVARFDHHCVWINNCVGANNHLSFLLMALQSAINHLTFLHLVYLVFSSLPLAPPLLPINISAVFYYRVEPMILILIPFHVANAAWQSVLFYTLAKGVLDNWTTNESINQQKYNYLRNTSGERVNPFDLGGKVANLKEFLFPRVNWYSLYAFPTTRQVTV